jgi:CRISPR-associated protein Csx10
MAIELTLILRACAPLALHRTRTKRQFVESLEYVPGSTVRGAFAALYISHFGVDADFKTIFLEDKVFFPDLWPARENTDSVLLPLSARACKRYGISHQRSLTDSLLPEMAQTKAEHVCPECNGKLDRVGGYLLSSTPIEQLHLGSRLRMNTAIDGATGSVAHGQLFSHHTIIGHHLPGDKSEREPEDILFKGRVYVNLADIAPFEKLRKLTDDEKYLSFGNSRSRGLGEVEIVRWQETTAEIPSLQTRWQDFNRAAKKFSQNKTEKYFSVSLVSHLCLRDKFLRPILSEIDAQHFDPTLVEDNELPRFVASVTVPGWNAVLGMPKPDSVALGRGSVWLFRIEASKEFEILPKLAALEKNGLGERRAEGFGRLSICHPFHYQLHEV